MWRKLNKEQLLKTREPISLDADLVFCEKAQDKPKYLSAWIIVAWASSLLIHALLLIFMAPKLEELTASPKVPLQAGLTFKPVVMTAKKREQVRPKTARYYSDQDQSTNKEQSARLSHSQAQAPRPATFNQAKPRMQAVPRSPGFKAPTKDDFLADPGPADPLGLKPMVGSLGTSGGMPFGDHLPEVAEGEHSELNTWIWRHAPFFNRIKAQIGQVWAPNIQIARYDPEGILLGQVDRVTIMSVTIDTEGQLKELAVKNSSGVSYLDEEAERAFKVAAPFPFPPQELFNGPEGFTFNFAFHLKVNRGMKLDFEWNKGD